MFLRVPIGLILIWSVGGVAQALLLRKNVKPIAWIAGTAIGAMAVLIIGEYNRREFNARVLLGFAWIVEFLIAVAIGQWLVLQRYVKNAKEWYLAAIFTAIAVFMAFDLEIRLGATIQEVSLNWLLAGLILGSAQAFVLRRFRKKKALARKI